MSCVGTSGDVYEKIVNYKAIKLAVKGEYMFRDKMQVRLEDCNNHKTYYCDRHDFYNNTEFALTAGGYLETRLDRIVHKRIIDGVSTDLILAPYLKKNCDNLCLIDINDPIAQYFCTKKDFVNYNEFSCDTNGHLIPLTSVFHVSGRTNTSPVSLSTANETPKYKFDESIYLDEIKQYIDSTYFGHYGADKIQVTEIIIDSGHGEGFNLGNIIKYAKRYGKKDGKNRKDLLKIIHYAMIALYDRDNNLLEEDPNSVKKT